MLRADAKFGAVNRDPDTFPDPDAFIADRENAHEHLSFGSGRHFCLGAALARMEARNVFGKIIVTL